MSPHTPEQPNEQSPTPQPTKQPLTSETKPASPFAPKKRKFSKKTLLIGGVVVAAVVIALAGAWLVYAKPQRVLVDAFGQTLSAESASVTGDVTVTTKGDENFKVTSQFTAEGNNDVTSSTIKAKLSSGALDISLSLDLIGDKDATYLRLANAKALADAAAPYTPYGAVAEDMAQKINNKWIKIPNKGDQTWNKCATLLSNLQLSQSQQQELRKLFEAHEFATGKRVGFSIAEQQYELSFHEKEGQAFFKEALKLESFKELKSACNISDDNLAVIEEDSTNKANKSKVLLTVNSITHKPTKLTITYEDDDIAIALNANFSFSKKITVTTPTSSVTFDELLKEFETQSSSAINKSLLDSLTPAEQKALEEQLKAAQSL